MQALLLDEAKVPRNCLSFYNAQTKNGETYFYAISLSAFGNLNFDEINLKFQKKRALRKVYFDFLGNSGNLIHDESKSRILTGTDSSMEMVKEIFGLKMTLIKRSPK